MRKVFAIIILFMLGVGVIHAKTDNPIVQIKTNMGDIIVELYPKKAPITCNNFLSYVNDGFYKGTIFHRVIRNFVIQGGGLAPGLKQRKTKDPIKNEANNGLSNKKYSIAMARTNIVNSATSQFFINTNNNEFLNFRDSSPQGYGYAVFGSVISGRDVVDSIAATKTIRTGNYSDVPKNDVIIQDVQVLRSPEEKVEKKAETTET
jgi:cyclophilin family peptidyl-prolyl cis-trans isomerase